MTPIRWNVAAIAPALSAALGCPADAADARFREVIYDPHSVVTVRVQPAVPTLILLGSDEAITDIGTGLGSDCKNAQDRWCIAAQPGGRTIFVKPKSAATGPNNLNVLTDRRVHTFEFVLRNSKDPRPPVHVLVVKAPSPLTPIRSTAEVPTSLLALPPLELPEPVRPDVVVAERLQAKPQVVNTQYTLAEGHKSEDIVPSLVFDDGRFTYLRFPGNREMPAVFHVLGDGSESLVNVRMEDDLLVVDRVSRHLMLRAGNAVVGLWNEAFDLDGSPPEQGTTVPGVKRVLRAALVEHGGSAKEVSP